MKVCFYPRLKHFIMQQVWNDPKSCLQQCCLTLRPEEGSPDLPDYKVVQNSGSVQKKRYKGNEHECDFKIGMDPTWNAPKMETAENFGI